MLAFPVAAGLLALALQEAPLLRGAYRGPYEEVLIEEAAAAKARRPLVDGWDRWEFWFEHEKEFLFRGAVEFPPAAVAADGRYGRSSLTRHAVMEQAVPRLLRALAAREPELREAAALALGRIGGPEAGAALRSTVADPVGEVRQAALLALGSLGDGEGLSCLAEVFSDRTRPAGERAIAAVALGLAGCAESRSLLAGYLEWNLDADRVQGEEEKVLLGALFGAGVLRAPELTRLLCESVAELEAVAAASSRRVRTVALHALGASGDPAARPFLAERLFCGDAPIERAAAQALGRLGDRGALPALAARFAAGGDLETRLFCLLGAGRLGGPSAHVFLESAREEARRHRQLRAAWALAVGLCRGPGLGDIESELRTRPGGEAVSASVRRDEERYRGALALALGLFGDVRSEEALEAVLAPEGSDPDFLGYVATALGALRGPRALETLLGAVQRGPAQADFRRGLALGLGLTREEAAAEAITGLLIEDPDPSVRWCAARALSHARSATALARLCSALDAAQGREPARVAHWLLGLGYLGDRHVGEGLGSVLSGLNYRQEFPLLRALGSY